MTTTSFLLDQIEEGHLQGLLDNRVPEGRDLEFKRDPVGRDDAAKKEFLKDVSALANTAGGDLIIGVGEDDGVAASLHGITLAPADDEIRRLEAILQDGIEPRLIGTRMRAVQLAGGGYLLVIRVLASWNSPHRVVYQRTNRFFARNTGAAYELGVEQLRAAFLGSAETERRLNDFRFERLARLKGGVGTSLIGVGKMVLHIAPLQPPRAPLDVRTISNDQSGFRPLGRLGTTGTPNFDGFLLMGGEPHAKEPWTSSTQIFRNGRLEAGLGGILYQSQPDGPHIFSHSDDLPQLIQAIPRYCESLFRLGVAPPFVAMISLLGVGGSVMNDPTRLRSGAGPLDRDDLLFEHLLIEDAAFPHGWQTLLRPMLDALWNAYGRQRCFPLFNEEGVWTGYPQGWPPIT